MANSFNDDAELYGPELIRDVQKWTQPVVDQRVQHLESRLNQQQSQLNQSRIESALDRDPDLASSWRKQNTDPEFLTWLRQVDELTGMRR